MANKSLVALGAAAALGAVSLTTTPDPAAAQAFLVPAVVGAFLGAAATSHYYGPYGYGGPYGYYNGGGYGYNGYFPASSGWGQSCGWGQCSGWAQPCGWQSCGGGGSQPVVIIVR